MGYIRLGTGKEKNSSYSPTMRNSVHFSYSSDGRGWEELHQGGGILYASAVIRQDNTLEERCLINPRFVQTGKEGVFGIAAEWADAQGRAVDPDTLLLWTTEDFVTFTECGPVDRKGCVPAIGAAEGQTLEIPGKLERGIRNRWLRVRDPERENRYPFPLAEGYADPVVFFREGSWYFTATNDNLNDVGIYVRKAPTVEGLFAPDVKEYCILDYDEEREYIQTFWAPELHQIGDDIYLLFAVGGKKWSPQSHMMKLKKGGSIINREDWEEPVRVRRRDGTFLTKDGITLDMTHFEAGGKDYVVWSQRFGIGTLQDSGSMLCIAQVDRQQPWQLVSDPVLLARPLYSWENQSGTINNEGPFALILGEKIYLAYSGGAAGGYSYAVGYLTAESGSDLLCADSWKKTPCAVLSSDSRPGICGPGHNSFFRDEEGNWWNACHAQESPESTVRSTAILPVYIGEDGFPGL